MADLVDTAVAHAVRAAAVSGRCERLDVAFLSAFRAAGQGTTEPLDNIIRTRALKRGERDMLPILDALLKHGTRLGPGESDMLDALDRGDLRPVGGRGAALTQGQQRRVAARYLLGGANKQIMADLVAETGMDKGSVLGWVRQLRATLNRAPDPLSVLRSIVDQGALREYEHGTPNLNNPPE